MRILLDDKTLHLARVTENDLTILLDCGCRRIFKRDPDTGRSQLTLPFHRCMKHPDCRCVGIAALSQIAQDEFDEDLVDAHLDSDRAIARAQRLVCLNVIRGEYVNRRPLNFNPTETCESLRAAINNVEKL